MSKEVWKDIPGFEGRYEVSNLGRIRSLIFIDRGKMRILHGGLDREAGYRKVFLAKGPKKQSLYIHRLVMLAFRGDSDLEVNHINEVKDDNRLENLEYCTRSENQLYFRRNGKGRGAKNWKAKLTGEQAQEIKELKKKFLLDIKDLAERFKVTESCVRGIASGKTWRNIDG